MDARKPALAFVDELAAEGVTSFSFEEAVQRCGRSPTATSNLLHRLQADGLVDRVRQGQYVLRPLGVLGTRAAAQDVALAVGAAFPGRPHRIAYRSALDEHDLISHPSRTLQVAASPRHRIRSTSLSGRPLRLVLEPEAAIQVGAEARGSSWLSDVNRALLDACARPELVGGAAVLAEAIATAAERADPKTLTRYARQLGWTAALRRLGSLADALKARPLAGALKPPSARSDIFLEPSERGARAWHDLKWRVVWSQSPEELRSVARQ